ncbi:19202_t:CDS:2, partial [Dentiscutata erythropus]
MPTDLENFPKRTQEIIHEWANVVQTKHATTEDKEDKLYMGDPLLIIERDENGLQQRGIQKTVIINAILGVQAQQIVQNIADTLQRTYAQRGIPTLGRVYVVVAERRNTLRITEN